MHGNGSQIAVEGHESGPGKDGYRQAEQQHGIFKSRQLRPDIFGPTAACGLDHCQDEKQGNQTQCGNGQESGMPTKL
ncbi:MAG: hypothetical protein SPiBPW_29740 [Shewanella algae]